MDMYKPKGSEGIQFVLKMGNEKMNKEKNKNFDPKDICLDNSHHFVELCYEVKWITPFETEYRI